jgi:hypothetical protein
MSPSYDYKGNFTIRVINFIQKYLNFIVQLPNATMQEIF